MTAFDRFGRDEPGFSAVPARVVRGDFLSRADLESAVAGNRLVFHFLSTSTPATADDDPGFDVRTNVAQSVDLFEICAAAGVEHVYFASTGGAIYGDQDRAEFQENDPALPVSPYAIGKLAIERYLAYFGARRGTRATALRISNPYGPRQRSQRGQGLIALSLSRILSGEPVQRFGDGGMVRDYIHVSDLVRMILAIVRRGARASHLQPRERRWHECERGARRDPRRGRGGLSGRRDADPEDFRSTGGSGYQPLHG